MKAVNDIFITHLSVDHEGELPYLYCFAPWEAVTGHDGAAS